MNVKELVQELLRRPWDAEARLLILHRDSDSKGYTVQSGILEVTRSATGSFIYISEDGDYRYVTDPEHQL